MIGGAMRFIAEVYFLYFLLDVIVFAIILHKIENSHRIPWDVREKITSRLWLTFYSFGWFCIGAKAMLYFGGC